MLVDGKESKNKFTSLIVQIRLFRGGGKYFPLEQFTSLIVQIRLVTGLTDLYAVRMFTSLIVQIRPRNSVSCRFENLSLHPS